MKKLLSFVLALVLLVPFATFGEVTSQTLPTIEILSVTAGRNGSVTIETSRALESGEVLICAVFEDYTLLNVGINRTSDTNNIYTVDVNIPENANRISVFIWNRIDIMQPTFESYTLEKGDGWIMVPPATPILDGILAERNLPDVLANGWNEEIRQEIIDLFINNMFGVIPPDPIRMEFNIDFDSGFTGNFGELRFRDERGPRPFDVSEICREDASVNVNHNWFVTQNNAYFQRIIITSYLSPDDFPGLNILELSEEQHKFEFVVSAYIPHIARTQQVPAIVALTYRDAFDDAGGRWLAPREIVERGVAVFAIRYRHLTNDFGEPDSLAPNGNRQKFNDTGLDRLFYGRNMRAFGLANRQPSDPSGIAFWSWGAQRVMDYIETLDFIDMNKVAVSGQSRLGKTSLFVGAVDERFTYVYSHASCAGGVALIRGEIIPAWRRMSWYGGYPRYWFAESIRAFEPNLPPFDMHWLVAAVAPRRIYVGNGWGDPWVHPYDEFLSLAAASPVWNRFGVPGLVTPDRLPASNHYHTEIFHDGYIGYHLHHGAHELAPRNWNWFLDFFLQDR